MDKERVISLLTRATMGVSKLPIATLEEISQTESALSNKIPNELEEFYKEVSNGMQIGRIKILPILSKANLKKTGDSLSRNNNVNQSIWFNGDKNSFDQFLIFAVEESFACFSFKINCESIWYWTIDSKNIEELDYGFWEWLAETIEQEKRYLRFS